MFIPGFDIILEYSLDLLQNSKKPIGLFKEGKGGAILFFARGLLYKGC
jgi:hypothetical protein